MNFPAITIPDPAAVGRWLDEQTGQDWNVPTYSKQGWSVLHWDGKQHHHAQGASPEEMLADIRRQLTENDPLAKLRKEWEEAGRPKLD